MTDKKKKDFLLLTEIKVYFFGSWQVKITLLGLFSSHISFPDQSEHVNQFFLSIPNAHELFFNVGIPPGFSFSKRFSFCVSISHNFLAKKTCTKGKNDLYNFRLATNFWETEPSTGMLYLFIQQLSVFNNQTCFLNVVLVVEVLIRPAIQTLFLIPFERYRLFLLSICQAGVSIAITKVAPI